MTPCLHCVNRLADEGEKLCAVCKAYPRCRVCEVIFGEGLSKPSDEDPSRCESCLGFEELIEFYCANPQCGKTLTLFYGDTTVLRYTVRGNFCGHCNSTANIESRRKKTPVDMEEMSGYLKIMAEALKRGSVSEIAFEEAKELNQHDINPTNIH